MKLKLFFAVILASSLHAQFQGLQFPAGDGVVPNNQCLYGPSYFPWDYPYMTYHAFIRDAQQTPIPYAPYILYAPTTTLQSGYHSHETQFTKRPGPVILDQTYGITDVHGNSSTFEVQLDGFSGWNTFSASLVGGTSYTCINNFLRYGTSSPVSRVVKPLLPYPENIFINQPQAFHYDDRHIAQLGPVYSRYLGEDYIPAFTGASTRYRTDSLNAGLLDRLDITRCSLPYGGISDNDNGAFAPGIAFGGNWAARPQEQHLSGRDCDVMNPAYNLPTSPLGALMLVAFHANTCVEGRFTPDGSYLPGGMPVDYWLTQDKIHITCAPVGTTKAPIVPPRR